MIEFKNVCYKYPQSQSNILDGVSFRLERGSYHFLSGYSGSGKTSLMKMLYLGKEPTSGEVKMFGHDITHLSREQKFGIRQRVGVVFQDFRLLKHLSTFENVALPLRIMDRPQNEINEHVNELLDWVGLGEHKDKLPATLSGGQQQRVAIARAVIAQPDLLLADEPTGNLDDEIGYRLMGLFEQLNRMGATILIATHNPQIIEKFGHPRLELVNGRIHNETPSNNIALKIRNVF